MYKEQDVLAKRYHGLWISSDNTTQTYPNLFYLYGKIGAHILFVDLTIIVLIKGGNLY